LQLTGTYDRSMKALFIKKKNKKSMKLCCRTSTIYSPRYALILGYLYWRIRERRSQPILKCFSESHQGQSEARLGRPTAK
jgi:hypothetical protein